MSLNNIQLKPLHLTQLYEKVLVGELEKKTEPSIQEIKFLGKNARNILVLVKEEEYPFVSDQQLQFLTAILSACKFSLADVAIVNALNMDIDEVQKAMDSLESINIIAFGIEPASMGLPSSFPSFRVQPFGTRYFILSPELAALEKDQDLKKQLWTSLKTMFKL